MPAAMGVGLIEKFILGVARGNDTENVNVQI